MYRFFYFAVVLITVSFIVLLLNKLRRKVTGELEKVLYIQNNPKLYLQLIKNPKLKILYSKNTLLQFELNAYLLLGDTFQIERVMNLLDKVIMTKGEKLEYNQKKLSYYCSRGEENKAKEALNKIQDILSKVKGNKAELIRKDSNLIFNIYIKRDIKLVKELEKTQKKEQGAVRGITLYRLAKLSYFNKDSKKTQAYLLEAKDLLKNTVWFDIVESAIKDMSVLNYK